MPLKNSELNYGLVVRTNHWLSAIIFISLIALGLYMIDLDESDFRNDLYSFHKSMGVVVLALVLFRIIWLKLNPNLESLSENKSEYILSRVVKGILYLALLGMPISGWVLSNSAGYAVGFFGLFELPTIVAENKAIDEIARDVHEIFGLIMIAVILLHIAGSLKHHLVYKDGTLLRMLGKNKE